ncbi:hypothetical protein GOQ29_14070 [Clostridium sp. D2Q-14]|uniref:hypothetical protein n=1 Tax=Anaeromonas gelatinilytica TaxID=2683194 RepID=UPI00193B40DF|nr:hypothetical protein [Anaeromonas gelatinilytica]MBS4536746.1 hypothetical protein [Anaeromonas gelatinilytica]
MKGSVDMTSSVSRTSNMKHRIHNSFVERSRQVMNTSSVEKVSPSSEINNNTYSSNENHLIVSDQFYDNLKKLKDEYYSFYHNERKLERAIKVFQTNKRDTANNMDELIKRYNYALNSLEALDKEFSTDYNRKIKNIVREYEESLDELGINIKDNERLKIDDKKFMEKIQVSNELESIIKPLRTLVIKLYKNFKSIKVPRNNMIEGYGEEYIEYSGILVNEKY